MMYSNKLVCSVKVGRKILREKVENGESTVFIPFGSEYSLMLKNLGGRNAVVHIEIDGRQVSENGFYIRAGQTTDIERFVESLVEGRRFKFIEKTEEISDFRGDKIDDGIIRVTWQFEKPLPEVKEVHYNYKHDHDHIHHHHYGCNCWWCQPRPIWFRGMTHIGSQSIGNNISYTSSGGGTQSSCLSSQIGSAMNNALNNVESVHYGESEGLLKRSLNNDAGITVEGSKSYQKFGTAYASELEPNVNSMVIILKGTRGKESVERPVIVREKFECSTCGKKWPSNFEFCGNCGTALRK